MAKIAQNAAEVERLREENARLRAEVDRLTGLLAPAKPVASKATNKSDK